MIMPSASAPVLKSKSNQKLALAKEKIPGTARDSRDLTIQFLPAVSPGLRCIAVFAIYRPITTGLEGNQRRFTAIGTYGFIHLPVCLAIATTASAPRLIFAGSAAFRTAAGFIGKTLFCIEFLFGSSESEFVATIPASENFV
jgi:hypothetical protein